MQYVIRRSAELAQLRQRVAAALTDIDDPGARADVVLGVSELAGAVVRDGPVRVTASVVPAPGRGSSVTVVFESSTDEAWSELDPLTDRVVEGVGIWQQRPSMIGGSAAVLRRRVA